jgi:hypothetical protein
VPPTSPGAGIFLNGVQQAPGPDVPGGGKLIVPAVESTPP